MDARTTPNKWMLLKTGQTYKVFGTWSGGFADPDSWKLNSGIEKVEDEGDCWLFHGFSGSVYQCHKQLWGTTGYGSAVLESWKEDIEVMSPDFDPMTLNKED